MLCGSTSHCGYDDKVIWLPSKLLKAILSLKARSLNDVNQYTPIKKPSSSSSITYVSEIRERERVRERKRERERVRERNK